MKSILSHLHTRRAIQVSNRLIKAFVTTGDLTHVSPTDTSENLNDAEYGPTIDQTTQVCSFDLHGTRNDVATQVEEQDIVDIMTTIEMSQWEPLVDIPQLTEHYGIIESTIKPEKIHFNTRAFKNYTNIDIPVDVAVILSTGPKFAVPIYYKKQDFKKLKEAAFLLNDIYVDEEDQSEIRTQIIDHIRQ